MNKKYRIFAFAAALLMLSSCGAPAPANTQAPAADSASDTPAPQESSDSISSDGSGKNKDKDKDKNKKAAVVGFSAASGFYDEAFSLELSCDEGEIWYTTDGSDPAGSGAVKYTGPVTVTDRKNDRNVVSAVDPGLFCGSFTELTADKKGFVCSAEAPSDSAVDKCTVVRAIAKLPDGTYGAERNEFFFIGEAKEHIKGFAQSCEAAGSSLAVISLCVGYDDLFDSKNGIYVKGDVFDKALENYLSENGRINDPDIARRLEANYNQHGKTWERRAAVNFMELSGDGKAYSVMSQNCGIRIQGNYSRSDLQKGFRLYARSDYGKKNFKYPVFGENYKNDEGKVMDKFDTLILRAGGNCAFTSKFNDAFWQSLVRGTACETKQSRPCVVYLNGEYWGLYVLEEDYTDDYFNDVHGVKKDDVVVYKGDAEKHKIGYELDEGEIPAGESEDYYFASLLKFFKEHSDAASDKDYEQLCELVDPQSVMDYFAVQCWINNKWDWPGKNWSMWKTINTDDSNPYADGRWRFMFYDVEFGGVSGKGDVRTNTIKEDNYKPDGLLDKSTNNPAVLCFAYMMTNQGFRSAFTEKLAGLSSGMLEKEAALTRLKGLEDIYSPLFDQFFERYPGSGSTEEALTGGYASSQCIRDFLEERGDFIRLQIKYIEKKLGS